MDTGSSHTGLCCRRCLLYTLLRQQQLQELKLRLSEVQSTWEIAENHYHEIENRREEFAKIRHDMRNQQMVLQELLHQGEYEKAEKCWRH